MEEKFTEVMVTGGAGFIGSNLVRELIPLAEKVVIVDNLSTGRFANIKELLEEEKVQLNMCDIAHKEELEKVFEKNNIEYISHQAAIPSVPRSFKDPLASNKANVTGTLNVLQLAAEYKVKKVIFASSSSVYGDTPTLPKQEDMKPDPLSPYAVTKLTGEHYGKVYNDNGLVRTASLRYFNIYGPYQDPNSEYSAVIPLFIRKALRNEPITINGDGEQTRDFTYVKNACQANIKALLTTESDGKIMNVGCGERISINKLAEIIKEKTRSTSEVKHGPERPGDVRDSLADINYAQKYMEYEPKIKLEEGLVKTIEYFKYIST